MKKEYRSSLKRLAAYFESSRDKWKARCLVYQQEKRALQIQVRDLKRSLDNWKTKYKNLEQGSLKKKQSINKEAISRPNSEKGIRIKGHHYDTACVLVSMSIFLTTNVGFRGTSQCFKAFGVYGLRMEDLSYSCVRQWVLRLGYGLLQKLPPRRSDWIYIMDYSIQLGCHRCLLIIGVTQESLVEQGYNLNHHQMKVLDLYISPTHYAEEVYKRLLYCVQKTGVPQQIICDHGADVRKGAERLGEKYPGLICTYDITHKIGLLLKKYLEKDPRWQNLQDDLRLLTHQIKQSELSFLRPLSISQKSRWLNIDKLIACLSNIFQYQSQGDFTLIGQGYKIANHEQIAEQLIDKNANNNTHRKIRKLLANTVFDTPQVSDQSLIKGLVDLSCQIQWIASGKQRFEQKFHILQKHKPFIEELQQAYLILSQVKHLVKNQGLSLDLIEQVEYQVPFIQYTWIRDLYRDLNNYLVKEHAKVGPSPLPLLLCSDIIESIFGKFKTKIKQAVGGLYQTVLMIPLFCEKLDHANIREVLQTVRLTDVEAWMEQMRGISNLAKRRRAFSSA